MRHAVFSEMKIYSRLFLASSSLSKSSLSFFPAIVNIISSLFSAMSCDKPLRASTLVSNQCKCVSRSALKIVVMTRQRAEGRRQKGRGFWTTLLFVTCFGFFALFYLVDILIFYDFHQKKIWVFHVRKPSILFLGWLHE